MSKKIIRCFTYNIKNKNAKVDSKFLKNVIDNIFSNEDTKELSNGNKVYIMKCEDKENYLSLEYMKVTNGFENDVPTKKTVPEDYIFFRIGREKDIEGAMKRNLKTWEGTEIIEKDKQDSYNLEICTYILIDTTNGIILELFGRYAPTVKSLENIINNSLEELSEKDLTLKDISFEYLNIMTEKLVNSFSEKGETLNKIGYKYAEPNPDLEFLKQLGLTAEEVNVIRETNVFEIEVEIKGRSKVPLTKKSDIIKKIISIFERSDNKVKKNVTFKGRTSSTVSKNYSFNEEEVTFNIDLSNTKKIDNKYIKLSLDEISYKVYNSLDMVYNNNKEVIKSYIK